jgi:hypothetical protein
METEDNKAVRSRRFDCDRCGGRGWVSTAAHDPSCDGSCFTCPVEEQAECGKCGGAGFLEKPLIRLWIDDTRDPPDSGWTHVRTCDEAVRAVDASQPERVSFDHDLGEGGTGYDVACFVERLAYDGKIGRFEWDVHSANPVGAERIAVVMRNADKFWSEQEKKQEQQG